MRRALPGLASLEAAIEGTVILGDSPGPFISPETLDLLLRARAKLVGVDFWNVDDTNDPSRRVQTRLLAEEILIVEHLSNLGALPETGFRFFAVPPRIVAGASVPVRAFAEIRAG